MEEVDEGFVAEVGKPTRVHPAVRAAVLAERNLRRAKRRAARAREGRCPYCGRVPEAGFSSCGRCRELQRLRNAEMRVRRTARRALEARAAGPRRCGHCDGAGLWKFGVRGGRQYYRCKDCGRASFGDGLPPAPPDYPCPYCRGRCVRHKRYARNKIIFRCTVCGKYNTNLWPGGDAVAGRSVSTPYRSVSGLQGEDPFDGVPSGEGDVDGAGGSRHFYAGGPRAADADGAAVASGGRLDDGRGR